MVGFLIFGLFIFLKLIKIMEPTNETAHRIAQFISIILWVIVIVFIIYVLSIN
jgi:hypothetical protein